VPQQRRGLGRGLGALIPAAPGGAPGASAGMSGPAHGPGPGTAEDGQRHVAGAYFDEVPIGSITPNPRQPRQEFDEDTLAELADSIREVGLLQPVVVRPVMPGHYELIVGERRWRAAQRAGLERIPAIVRETSEDDLLRDALIENLHREQLNPLEEAAAYQQLLDDFGATHDQLAKRIGRSRPHISNTLRLLNLPPLLIYMGALMSAMPSAANAAIFAETYESDAKCGAANVGLSTLFSIASIPFIIWLVELVI